VEKPGNSGILKTAGDLWEDSYTLVGACDIVLAADDAVCGLPEIDSGIFPMVAPLFCSVQWG
jgi:enoyl-CoA hydratase/carnithine racemase